MLPEMIRARWAHLGVLAALVAAAAPRAARAAVTGAQGVEIEGTRDRRGFFFGPGIGFGVSFFGRELAPGLRLDFALGGGVTKRVTLGVGANFTKFLGEGQRFSFGGDFEVTGFVYQGLFLRGGLGVGGTPEGDASGTITAGFGGLAGLGYEFWLNQSVAMSAGAVYDLRFTPDGSARQGAIAIVRFTWY